MNLKVIIMFLLITLVQGKAMLKAPIKQQGLHHNEKENYATKLGAIAPFQPRDTAPTNVAFMARLTHNITNPPVGQTVIFNEENLDTANSYDPKSGIFTVPVSGVYYISLTAATNEEKDLHYLHLYIKKDGTSIGYLLLDENDDFWLRRNEVILVHLNAGDTVYVQIDLANGPCTLIGGGMTTRFQGYMIFRD